MSLLLNIDTAVDTASVCVSNDTEVIKLALNKNQKDHASWLHIAINEVIRDAGMSMSELDGVGVSIGPGSYTGLRIGLSSAKGLCYALNIPLITVGTLEMMAHAVKSNPVDLICPLIDARRMEVFTAIYDSSFKEIIKPCAMVVDKNSFGDFLSFRRIIFCGNGSIKLQSLISHINAIFDASKVTAADLVQLTHTKFSEKKFSDLAYCEPLYVKEFYTTSR